MTLTDVLIDFSMISILLVAGAWLTGTARIGPQKSSMLSTFEPLTSVAAGAALFGEPVTPRTAIGITCILCAVLLLARGEKSGDDRNKF
ncbi:EamA family transporter [[Clostridium] symbiosum]|uniref:EamA family transporter n=1 Tax=Clostridium symbiosum TaxID=1512 RepID=UPI001D098420|nr:EamA family transporter [[Clostridium] symbiosum]MCB6608555.1 DMT family transporter [[Clostridium] symbiosum]MCB6932133.1 DMT family transporter [[Clostridium] symbiosum]